MPETELSLIQRTTAAIARRPGRALTASLLVLAACGGGSGGGEQGSEDVIDDSPAATELAPSTTEEENAITPENPEECPRALVDNGDGTSSTVEQFCTYDEDGYVFRAFRDPVFFRVHDSDMWDLANMQDSWYAYYTYGPQSIIGDSVYDTSIAYPDAQYDLSKVDPAIEAVHAAIWKDGIQEVCEGFSVDAGYQQANVSVLRVMQSAGRVTGVDYIIDPRIEDEADSIDLPVLDVLNAVCSSTLTYEEDAQLTPVRIIPPTITTPETTLAPVTTVGEIEPESTIDIVEPDSEEPASTEQTTTTSSTTSTTTTTVPAEAWAWWTSGGIECNFEPNADVVFDTDPEISCTDTETGEGIAPWTDFVPGADWSSCDVRTYIASNDDQVILYRQPDFMAPNEWYIFPRMEAGITTDDAIQYLIDDSWCG